MNYPGKQEFADCKTIAADIITEMCNQNPPDFFNNVNNRPQIGSLNTVHLSIAAVTGDFSAKYHELEKLSAEVSSNAIVIYCPFNNARLVYVKNGNRDHLSSLERAIYGAIVHE
ncbi:hypothetical protein, partial [Agrobacterium sp. MCAB5]|uniref:hypothetical protein n=1 Tax=Agrobacterium sp. MCAB5 TaxID=3233042 RepID=UPI003F910BDA